MDDIEINKTDPTRRIPPMAAVLLGAAATLFISLAATPVGGLVSLVIATAALSLLLISNDSFLAFLPIPAAYVLAVIFTGNPVLSLVCLLSVPAAFALRICYAKNFSLSVTVIVCAVVMGLCFGGQLLLDLYFTFGSVTEGIAEIRKNVGGAIDASFQLISELAEQQMGEGFISVTDESIRLFKKSLLMSAPGVLAAVIQLAAYCSEKLMRALALLFRCPYVIRKNQRITQSVFAAAIFIVCYFITSFSAGDSVLYYSAENLLMILLPLSSVAGIHSLFGKGGLFRMKGRGFVKACAAVLCVMALFSSPVMLFILFALWGSAGTVSRAIIIYAMSKKN